MKPIDEPVTYRDIAPAIAFGAVLWAVVICLVYYRTTVPQILRWLIRG